MAAIDPNLQYLIEEITAEVQRRLQGQTGALYCEVCGGTCTGLCQRILVDAGPSRLRPCPPAPALEAGLAPFIDHTLLKPDATKDQILKLCDEARQFQFATVCVHTCWVALCVAELRETPVKVCAVVGFPHGATLASVKRYESAEALRLGADEIDMVINIGALKSGDDSLVTADIAGVVDVSHRTPARVKVILETALLTEEEKIRGCRLAEHAAADFVKTSTGFGPAGATVDDVQLMRRVVGECLGVKAAGGIRTYEQALQMIHAGASRVGASNSVAIMEQARGSRGGNA